MHVGIETTSTAERVAMGIATGDHEALVLSLNPSTFSTVGSARSRSPDPLRRVVPLFEPGTELSSFLETARTHTPMDAAHPIAGSPPFVVGVAAGMFAWAPDRTSSSSGLWPLPGDAPVDTVRSVTLGGSAGYAVAFRQGGALFLGALNADRTANGDLVRIPTLGPQVGAPALAAGAHHVLVAWADRPSTSAPWSIRWLRWHPGAEPEAAATFPIPAGGTGEQVMAPSLTALGDGRLVLVWTEGTGTRHVVRAQALDPAEQPVGTAITVSEDGINAGEGMPALTPDGRGAVVFFASPTGTTAAVMGVPILCPGAS
jgi:hypothetical protein